MGPFSYLYKEVTDSTMDDARLAVKSSLGSGTVCRAGKQNSGRGRMPGRRWEDDGHALLFTLVLHRDDVSASYPLTQTLALALCIRLERGYGLSPMIKWPNDVLVDSMKIAGILVETEGDYFLAGIGLNLSQRNFPSGLRTPATSLSRILDSSTSKKAILSAADELPPLLETIKDVLDEKPKTVEINRRLAGVGQPVSLLLGDPSRNLRLSGINGGIAADGALIVELPDGGQEEVYSGEILSSKIP
ncbi:MAG: biotin--[acetyl-CoA-carboxylase] ligase [Spirochaetaceae bacterium]|nr:biotin--[acetyl-CoA-carboxylase] ligase [Spirochaetaceae bacterium]MDT8298736.1 biotin--[acetyl-CoA-carboxylase] ligase [Spirochaetaceae bacterium]